MDDTCIERWTDIVHRYQTYIICLPISADFILLNHNELIHNKNAFLVELLSPDQEHRLPTEKKQNNIDKIYNQDLLYALHTRIPDSQSYFLISR